MSSNPTTYNPLDRIKLKSIGSAIGQYVARTPNFSSDFNIFENVPSNTYDISLASTGSAYNLYQLYKNQSKVGSFTPRQLNLSGDFSISEDTVNNFYNLGISTSRILKPSSYIIHIASDGSVHGVNGDTGSIDYSTNSAPANSTDTTSVFNGVFAALAPTGGLIFLRRGKYTINTPIYPGTGTPAAGSLSTYQFMQCEGRDNTIIQYDGTVIPANSTNMIMAKAPFGLDGVTVDGNNNTANQIFQSLLIGSYIRLTNNRFIPANQIGVYIVGLWGFNLQNNIWYHATAGFDQCAITQDQVAGANGFGIFSHNFMDKSSGFAPGSSLTSAGYYNVSITDNTILRQPANRIWGISLENWGNNYKNVVISNNNLVNADIDIGGGPNGGGTTVISVDDIIFSKNNMEGGTFNVYGGNSTTDAPAQSILVDGNNFRNSQRGSIHIENRGPTVISNNIIQEFNVGQDTVDGFRAGIDLYSAGGVSGTSSNVDIHDNTIYQTLTGTNQSGVGIRNVGGNQNIYVHDNRFFKTNSGIIHANNFSTSSNYLIYDNIGYVTNNEGNNSITGNGTLTDFTIPHGLSVTPIVYFAQADTLCYVSTADGTNITVHFPTAPATGSHTVNWRALKKVFA